MGVPVDHIANSDASQFFSPIGTLAVFGVITILVYLLILKPFALSGQRGPNANARNTEHGANGANANSTRSVRPRPVGNASGTASQQTSESIKVWPSSSRMPPHAAKIDALLIDGMVSFRNTLAASFESQDTATMTNNRKERATILSRILALDADVVVPVPPTRGSSIVITIPADDVDCTELRRILFLLSTYFCVVLVLSVEQSTTSNAIANLILQLRGVDTSTAGGTDASSSSLVVLPEEVLPTHRILAAHSRIGRIALVRQLGKVEFVLDHDREMKSELERFGFKVIVYDGTAARKNDGMSCLASQLTI